MERAINILKQRRESGRRTRIFVHQSAHSALNADLPAWLLGRLRAKQMVGTGLVIDYRLPDLSQDLKVAQKNIRALREMDVEVSLSRFPEKDAAFKVLRFLQAHYINIAPRLLKADRHVISNVDGVEIDFVLESCLIDALDDRPYRAEKFGSESLIGIPDVLRYQRQQDLPSLGMLSRLASEQIDQEEEGRLAAVGDDYIFRRQAPAVAAVERIGDGL